LILHKTGILRVAADRGQVHSSLPIIIEELVIMVAKEVLRVRVIMAVMGPVVEQVIAKEPGMVAAVVVLVQMEVMHLIQIILGNNIRGHNIPLGPVGLLMLVMVV
jgi:hypothetical protein